MKKVLLAAATVAMLFATSCKKDVNAPENIQLGENEFLATIDNGAVPQNAPAVRNGMSTMTTIDGERRVFWQAGDTITINDVAYKAKTTDNPVVFEPYNPDIVAPENAEYHAFYSVNHEQDGSVSLPNHQSYYGDTDVRNLPMYAYSTTKELTFHNICAVIKIVVPSFAANTDKIIISSDQQMNGSFSVDGNFKAAMIEPEEGLDDGDKMITMEHAVDGQKFSEGDAVYIAVPAQSYTNFKVEFFNGDNSVWCKTLASCTLAVNTVYPITMTEMPNLFRFVCEKTNGSITIYYENNTTDIPFEGLPKFEVSRDGETWSDYDEGEYITLVGKGDSVFFRAQDFNSYGVRGMRGGSLTKSDDDIYPAFFISDSVSVAGNIAYLINENLDEFVALPPYAFTAIFANQPIINADKLVLPFQTLTHSAFNEMFRGCNKLEKAPALPATELADSCYGFMFMNCTSLVAAPALPAMNLATSCYTCMFTGCSSLQVAPALPATTMVNSCYANMFKGCSSLNEVWIYATGGFNTVDCLSDWLRAAGNGSGTIHCTSAAKTFFDGGGSVYSYFWTVQDDLQ